MSWGSSDVGSQAVAQQKQQQQAVEDATAQINQAFGGFGQDFYNKASQDYISFAEPQVQQQYQQTEQTLQDKLANQGLMDSSAALTEQGALDKALAGVQQGVQNTATSTAQTLQEQIANEKATLISQANAASDPLSIAQQAIGQAAAVQAPNTFQPLGNLFQTFANTYLGNQLATTYNPNIYSTFLTSPSSSSGSYGAGLGGSQSIN